MNALNMLVQVIEKKAQDNVCVVGIPGVGGAGKTTMGKKLVRHFGADRCIAIDLDEYIMPRPEKLERGLTGYNPAANRMDQLREHVLELKNEIPVLKPVYDFRTGTFPTSERVDPKNIVVLAGVIALYDEVRDLVDVSMFLDASEEVQVNTRMKRDTAERGYSRQQILDLMRQFYRDYRLYLGQTKEFASIVCDVDENHYLHPVKVGEMFISAN